MDAAYAPDASAEFAKRMAKMQSELQEMQRVEQGLKEQEKGSNKFVAGLQKELKKVCEDLASTQTKRRRVEQELLQCDEELVKLEKRKAEISDQIFQEHSTVEEKRAEKLRQVVGSAPPSQEAVRNQQAVVQQAASQPTPSAASDLLGGLDFSSTPAPTATTAGSLGGLDFNAAAAPMVDLLDTSSSFMTPSPAPALAPYTGAPAPQQSAQSQMHNLGMQCGATASTSSSVPMLGGGFNGAVQQNAAPNGMSHVMQQYGAAPTSGMQQPQYGAMPPGAAQQFNQLPCGMQQAGNMAGGIQPAGGYGMPAYGMQQGSSQPPPPPPPPVPQQQVDPFLSLLGMPNSS